MDYNRSVDFSSRSGLVFISRKGLIRASIKLGFLRLVSSKLTYTMMAVSIKSRKSYRKLKTNACPVLVAIPLRRSICMGMIVMKLISVDPMIADMCMPLQMLPCVK